MECSWWQAETLFTVTSKGMKEINGGSGLSGSTCGFFACDRCFVVGAVSFSGQ